MNFDLAAKKYAEIRGEIAKREREFAESLAPLKQTLHDIETWITLKAQEEGLKTVPTPSGTAYWSTHTSASVADPAVFRQYCMDNGAWDLMETRASKVAVKSFIEGHGAPPPGVNFTSRIVFNLRENHSKE